MKGYDEDKQNLLFEAIYLGVIGLSTLPKNLYYQTANTLKKSLYKGYGGTLLDFDFGTPDYKLLKELRNSIYIFSGAKTATQIEDIKSLMYEYGKHVSLPDFKKKALTRFETYNKTYLDSEYITTQTTASSARNYRDALSNKNLFPTLTSHAIIDEFTAPECERMNKVTAPVDSPIWNHNLAARHFKCRCYEVKNDKYDKVKLTPDAEIKEIIKKNDKDMNDIFKINPVIDKTIFSSKHAYFDIGKLNPELAKKNFNLPIPKKDS